ncbi:MAG: ADP-ribosylglycohydrolase family protein [Patescibacteria group bacterium]
MKPTLLSKVQGCLAGVAIGDAMGMPWETMTFEQIMERTDGIGVTGFVDPIQQTIRGTMPLKAGDTTDDWQLTAAVARSLIRKRQFDIEDIAREQVLEFDRCTFGWGPTTRRSLKEIKRWFESGGKEGRNPATRAQSQGPNLGAGNGVAMKVAPLGLYASSRMPQREFMAAVAELGFLTHSDPRASHAAFVVAQAIAMVMMRSVSYSVSQVRMAEFWPLIHVLNEATLVMEAKYSNIDGIADSMQNRLSLIENQSSELFRDPSWARTTLGTECFCLQSVSFAIATFLRHPADFRTGILEAVSAGGDTDSTASMVGAMIGANVGLEGIPPEWRNFTPGFSEALKLGEELAGLIQERSSQWRPIVVIE